jgi:2-methylisocitrate lyase-like PEP mutase family enzyme
LRRLREYRDAGADILVLKLAASRGDRDVMVRQVAEEIVAPLREETADGS